MLVHVCPKKIYANDHQNCAPSTHRIHVPEDEDDAFLYHYCYKETNSDSSDVGDLYNFILKSAKDQGF